MPSIKLLVLTAFLFVFSFGCSSNRTPDPVRTSASANPENDNILLVTLDNGKIETQPVNLTHPFEFISENGGIAATNNGNTIFDLKLASDGSEYSFGIVEKGMTTSPLFIPLDAGLNKFQISFSDKACVEINGHRIHTDGIDESHFLWLDDKNGYVDNEVLFGFVAGTPDSERHRIIREHNLFLTGFSDISGLHVGRIDDGRNPNVVVSELAKEPSIKLPETNKLVQACWPSDIVWAASWPDDYRWAMQRIKAKEAWDIYKDGRLDDIGSAKVETIVLCIADTGVHPHKDFNLDPLHFWASKTFSINLVSPGTPPLDNYGHGTSVTGIAGAVGDNNYGIAGVSWGPFVISIKCLGDSGGGTIQSVGTAIDYIGQIAQLYPQLKFIGNFSLGHWGGDPWGQLAATATNALPNTLLVAAAGNWGAEYANSFFPSGYEEFMSIGASSILQDGDLDKEVFEECPRDWGTNWGTKVDVCAPGSCLVTTTNIPWTAIYNNQDPNCPMSCPTWFCQYFGGTSAATPHVVGLAALLWNKHPAWTKEQIREKIKSTADPMSIPPVKVGKLGTGRINCYRALTE